MGTPHGYLPGAHLQANINFGTPIPTQFWNTSGIPFRTLKTSNLNIGLRLLTKLVTLNVSSEVPRYEVYGMSFEGGACLQS